MCIETNDNPIFSPTYRKGDAEKGVEEGERLFFVLLHGHLCHFASFHVDTREIA